MTYRYVWKTQHSYLFSLYKLKSTSRNVNLLVGWRFSRAHIYKGISTSLKRTFRINPHWKFLDRLKLLQSRSSNTSDSYSWQRLSWLRSLSRRFQVFFFGGGGRVRQKDSESFADWYYQNVLLRLHHSSAKTYPDLVLFQLSVHHNGCLLGHVLVDGMSNTEIKKKNHEKSLRLDQTWRCGFTSANL